MEGVIILITLLGGLTGIGVLHQVGRAWAERLRHESPTDPDLAARVVELEQRLADLETDVAATSEDRIVELEERVEFTERLLQQVRSGPRVGPGGADTRSP